MDNASNNTLFLRFLGMLRSKYLDSGSGLDSTFHSVILADVHDVRNLKLKLGPDSHHQLNSPWNIATEFKVDLSLSHDEIAEILTQYTGNKSVTVDIPFFTERLVHLTSGYPFLVNYLCKIIDEEILPGKQNREWQPVDQENALQITLQRDNLNFQSLIKNLENNRELYDLVFNIIMNGREYSFNPQNKLMSFAFMYGILKRNNGKQVFTVWV